MVQKVSSENISSPITSRNSSSASDTAEMMACIFSNRLNSRTSRSIRRDRIALVPEDRLRNMPAHEAATIVKSNNFPKLRK